MDARNCGNLYPVDLVVENVIVDNNSPPSVLLTYDTQGLASSGASPAGGISVPSPAAILLDASGSTDPDNDPLTFTWQKTSENLSSGSVALIPSGATATLTALSATVGSVTVRVDRFGRQGAGIGQSDL